MTAQREGKNKIQSLIYILKFEKLCTTRLPPVARTN
jgi:hypothetical protein